MAQFIKHIGKHGDRRVAIVYRSVPDEEHMALVTYPDTLPTPFHDAIMKVIESPAGQQEGELADALFRSLLPDGRPILQTLHREGMIKKVRTQEIIVTPNAQSHVRLDELNKIFDGMEAGGEAAQKMADLDAHAGLVDPLEARKNAQEIAEAGADVLDDTAIAQGMIDQANKMLAEAESLTTEGKRLQEEAYEMAPKLKPKRKYTRRNTSTRATEDKK